MLSDNKTLLPVQILAGLIGIYFTIALYGTIRPIFPEALDLYTFAHILTICIFHLAGIYIVICEFFQGGKDK